MKRLVPLVLVCCLTITMAGASHVTDGPVEALYMNQPINRIVIDRNQPIQNQMPQREETQAEAVTYDYDDPYLDYQWAIGATNAQLVWEEAEEDYGVIVAVVDSGVDYDHEDLENRVLVSWGYDFVNGDSDPMDDNGHGTHVAGIIAAEADNGVGIAGIAGDLDVSILPIKVLDAEGSGETAHISAGILYAVEKGADIINLSLGADIISPDVREAVVTALDAGIFVVVAAGNDGTACTTMSLANVEGVFTVAAVTDSDTLAYFSNYGDCIDAYAPGVEILSTYLDDQYAYQDGTSMAAPIVSGAAALLLSQDPDLTVSEITTILSEAYTEESAQNTMEQSIPATNQIPTVPMGQVGQISNGIQMPMVQGPMVGQSVTWRNTTYTTSSSTICHTIDIYKAFLEL